MKFDQLTTERRDALERTFGPDASLLDPDGPGGMMVCRRSLGGAVVAIEEGVSFAGAERHPALTWAAGIFRGDTLRSYTGRYWPGAAAFTRAPVADDEPLLRPRCGAAAAHS